MSSWDDLLGLPYIEGRQDCYSIIREFCRRQGLILPNFARPQRFWEVPDFDFYTLYYKDFGFKPVFDQDPEPGDILLMPILTPINSHAVVYLGDNQILHHPPGQLSRTDDFRPKWSNRVTIHVRHPEIHASLLPEIHQVHFHEIVNAQFLRNPEVQKEIDRLLDGGS